MRLESCQAFEKASPENTQLLRSAQRHLRGEDVILLLCDSFEQAAININQNPQRWLAVLGNIRDQLVSGDIKLASAVGLEREERTKPSKIRSRKKVLRGQAKFHKIFFREIDTPHGCVFLHVANDVGELEGEAAPFGKFLGGGITIAKNVNANESNNRSDTIAIETQVLKRLVLHAEAGCQTFRLFDVHRSSVRQFVE